MNKHLLVFLLFVFIFFNSCKKDSNSDTENYGGKVNTWTFTEGSKVFSGVLVFDYASLNTFLQVNNSYNFAMLGVEKTSGYLFNVFLSLLDLNFTTKTYQSGKAGNDYLNAFYYSESAASVDNIYKSSNLDPGPVMTYTITAYDAAKDIVTITFNGQAQLANGNFISITNGKVTAKVDRF